MMNLLLRVEKQLMWNRSLYRSHLYFLNHHRRFHQSMRKHNFSHFKFPNTVTGHMGTICWLVWVLQITYISDLSGWTGGALRLL